MKIIKAGKPSEEFQITCDHCQTELAKTFWYPWERIGVETSRQVGYDYIECPICYNRIKLKELSHEF